MNNPQRSAQQRLPLQHAHWSRHPKSKADWDRRKGEGAESSPRGQRRPRPWTLDSCLALGVPVGAVGTARISPSLADGPVEGTAEGKAAAIFPTPFPSGATRSGAYSCRVMLTDRWYITGSQ